MVGKTSDEPQHGIPTRKDVLDHRMEVAGVKLGRMWLYITHAAILLTK